MYNALFAEINPHHKPAPLTDANIKNTIGAHEVGQIVLALLVTTVLFVGVCTAIAAVVTRSQKRGRSYLYESPAELSKLFD